MMMMINIDNIDFNFNFYFNLFYKNKGLLISEIYFLINYFIK